MVLILPALARALCLLLPLFFPLGFGVSISLQRLLVAIHPRLVCVLGLVALGLLCVGHALRIRVLKTHCKLNRGEQITNNSKQQETTAATMFVLWLLLRRRGSLDEVAMQGIHGALNQHQQ